jgi:hypothetical protein
MLLYTAYNAALRYGFGLEIVTTVAMSFGC